MVHLSLREAAERTGVSKSTIWRGISSGKISAQRDGEGNFLIDPAELFRVYPPKAEKPVAPRPAGRDAQSPEGQNATAALVDHETAVRLATAEAQLAGLKELLEAERRRGEELRTAAEKWERQAERLSLVLAAPKPAAPQPETRAPHAPMPEVSTGLGKNSDVGPTLTIRLPRWLRRAG